MAALWEVNSMAYTLLRLFLLLLISNLTLGQGNWDWPSPNFEHSYESPDEKEGLEYYESGNLRARGPLKQSGLRNVVKTSENRRQVKETVYDRAGLWIVYYDSAIRVVRSTGEYVDGKKIGLWKVFDRQGNVRSEYTFYNDVIKKQIEV